jgi:hypothetical protein
MVERKTDEKMYVLYAEQICDPSYLAQKLRIGGEVSLGVKMQAGDFYGGRGKVKYFKPLAPSSEVHKLVAPELSGLPDLELLVAGIELDEGSALFGYLKSMDETDAARLGEWVERAPTGITMPWPGTMKYLAFELRERRRESEFPYIRFSGFSLPKDPQKAVLELVLAVKK